MPLRSVEAATRDDAIAAAREQFGPKARVVGIRRVRSGGVLGFFATERYVAEVDPDNPTGTRPSRPRPARPDADDTPRAELASGGPASAGPASAELASAELQAKVKELVGLLGSGENAEPVVPTYTRASAHRATPRSPASVDDVFPAAASPRATITASLLKSAETSPAPWIRSAPASPAVAEDDDEDGDAPGTGESLPPSPFTAALARMGGGDRSVREAVREALDQPAADRVPTGARDDDGSVEGSPIERAWSAWIGQATPLATPVDTGAGHDDMGAEHPETGAQHHDTGAQHREEETPVGEQEVVSPSLRAALEAEEYPAWAAEPEPAPAPVSPREEEIAAVLRAALAQGHSDEALADILRKVLAGTPPQAALPAEPPVAEPAAEVAPRAVEEPSWPEPEPEPSWVEPEPTWAEPGPLWAEVAHAERTHVEVRADAPIWAEVVLQEPAPAGTADDVVRESGVTEAAFEAATAVQEPATVESSDVAEPAAVEVPTAEAEPLPAVAASVQTPLLARTASDPAPLPLDATAVLPPLSLLPPRPSARRGGGLPPVPPPARPPVPPAAPAARSAATAPEPSAPTPPVPPRTLATVTRLPVAPLHEPVEAAADVAEAVVVADVPVTPAPVEPPAAAPSRPAAEPRPGRRPSDVVGRLRTLGLPEWLLGDAFAADVTAHGTYAALTRALGNGLPKAAELPTEAGEALLVVGPGVETLIAARSLAAALRLDPDRVQWASRGELAGLAPAGSRMTTVESAIERRQEAAGTGTLTIVAVDAPLRADGHWMAQMLAIWTPAAVWAVVDATRKPEDVEPWLDGLPRVDALMVQDTDLSADPAAVLQRIAIPVALLDGVPATPHRWASVLCERLEKQQG